MSNEHANVETRAALYPLVLLYYVSAVKQKLVQGVRLNLLHMVLAMLNEPLDGWRGADSVDAPIMRSGGSEWLFGAIAPLGG